MLDRLRSRPRSVLLAVLALTLAACLPALANGFAYDGAWIVQVDGKADGGNPWVRELHAPWAYWNHEFHDGIGTPAGLFRPALLFSFALTRAVLGPLLGDALAQHLVNVALHLGATALVFALTRRLGGGALAAGAAALVFGLHALHAEVVAGVISRSELLGFACGLGGILLALPAAAGRAVGWPRALGAGTLLFVAFSSKESALAFLPLLPVAAFAVAHRDAPAGTPVRALLRTALRPLLVVGVPAAVPYLALRVAVLARLTEPVEPFWVMNPLLDVDGPTRVINAIVLWASGVWRTLWPPPLACDYSSAVFTVRDAVTDPVVLGAALVMLALVAGTLAAARRRPWLFLAGAAFLGPSLVTSNLLFAFGTNFAERFYYAPSLGLALVAGWLVERAVAPRVVAAVLTLWLAANAGALVQRIPDWNDSATLFARDVRTRPDSAHLHALNARVANDAGRHDDALAALRRAVEIEPRYATAWADLGGTLMFLGRPDEAEPALRRAIDARWQQALDRPAAHLNLAAIERGRGHDARAAAELRLAITADPGFVPAWAALRELFEATRASTGPAAARALLDDVDATGAPPEIRAWLDAARR